MKKIITLLGVLLMGWSINTWAFNCKTADGAEIPIGGGSADVHVNLTPSIGVGENLVVDLSTQITCANDSDGGFITDYIALDKGSMYSGALENFSGTVRYNGSSFPFPLTSVTQPYSVTSESYLPWPTMLYLTPLSTAGGVVIKANSLFAILVLSQTNSHGSGPYYYTWNIYANNDVVIPTGGCDVSARDVTVTLPDYPGNAQIPLTVHCAKNQNLGFYLSGTTVDASNTVFANTASNSPAQDIGVQLMRRGNVMQTNSTISLGDVGTSPVNLDLSATYAQIGNLVTAGNVQSVVGVTFVYQ